MSQYIELADGTYWYFDKQDNSISPEVIASSLSKLCRYTGHCNTFYSVAEHCVHVSKLVPYELAFEGLMHDAHECLTNDLSKPFKIKIGGSYEEWEDRIETEVRRLYKLSDKLNPIIKKWDNAMMLIEANYLMPSEGEKYLHTDHISEPSSLLEMVRDNKDQFKGLGIPPKDAEKLWLSRYYELFYGGYFVRDSATV